MTDQTEYDTNWMTPDSDGETHIWLSHEGKTFLGRSLYIGARRPFVDPTFGAFESIFAFLVWYDNGQRDSLRDIHHDVMIRSSMAGMYSSTRALSETIEVLRRSILSDQELRTELAQSTLPFATYEYIKLTGRETGSTYPLKSREWYVNAIESLRYELKAS